MDKAGVDAAISTLEAWGRTLDNWVLIFAVGVAICLAAEVIFSVAHWRNDKKLRPLRATQTQLHEEELAKLNAQTAASMGLAYEAQGRSSRARRDAAKANERAAQLEKDAAEAKLELEKYKAPRRLTTEQKAQIAEKLKQFSGVAFAMSAVGPEPIDLAIDTADALKSAGWNWIPWSIPGLITNLPGRPAVGSVALNGTEIQVFDPKLANAGNALINALAVSQYEGVRTGQGAAPQGADAHAILIMIGTKK